MLPSQYYWLTMLLCFGSLILITGINAVAKIKVTQIKHRKGKK